MKAPLSKVIVLAEGLYSSQSAVKYAVALARNFGSSVIAVYAIDTLAIKQLADRRIFIAEESEEYERSLEETGQRRLSYARELGKSKGVEIETRLLRGSIAGEVLRVADEEGVDCIILGGWEQKGDVRDILLEASREIVNIAPCSVLIVKGLDAERVFSAL